MDEVFEAYKILRNKGYSPEEAEKRAPAYASNATFNQKADPPFVPMGFVRGPSVLDRKQTERVMVQNVPSRKATPNTDPDALLPMDINWVRNSVFAPQDDDDETCYGCDDDILPLPTI